MSGTYEKTRMSRTFCFAKRNLTEMSRDALSYVFCVAFPLVMLAIMTVVDKSIPAQGPTTFHIDNLAGGIVVFGQTFVMLFMGLTVSKDRGRSFLVRLYASPMKSSDFTNGYILPMLGIAVLQSVISLAAAWILSMIMGKGLNICGLLAAVAAAIPSAVMFIAIGLLFGSLFSENTAPGMCSVLISLGSIVGGIWFDAEGVSGPMETVCKSLPFLYCTRSVRAAVKMDFSAGGFWIPLGIVTATAVILTIAAAAVFRTKMKADLA